MSTITPTAWVIIAALFALTAAVSWAWILLEGMEVFGVSKCSDHPRRCLRLALSLSGFVMLIAGALVSWDLSSDEAMPRVSAGSKQVVEKLGANSLPLFA